MKNKIMYISHWTIMEFVLKGIKKMLRCAQLLLFLYSKKKNVFEVGFESIELRDLSFSFMYPMLKGINEKVKCRKYKNKLIYYKNINLNIKKFINCEKYIAKCFGIPKCCYKRYIEEQEKNKDNQIKSFPQAVRYVEESKGKNCRDDFVKIKPEGVLCKYGFVPCSPKCKKAKKIRGQYIKILENYKETEKWVLDRINKQNDKK